MLKGFAGLLLLLNVGAPSAPIQHESFDMSGLLEVHPVPIKAPLAVAPVVDAKAALIMDVHTGMVLFEKNAHEPLPMASLTKIMTAILILEDHDMNEIVEVDRNFGYLLGVKIGLFQGEKLTVRDLLRALLIRSAGDAAVALAVHHSGSVEAFVEAMNQRAIDMSLADTVFENPVGLDAPEQHSTASDLAYLTRYSLRFPEFRDIVQRASATITSESGNDYVFANTNHLLGGYLDVRGVKTGTTDGAGPSLIALVRGPNNTEVIAVSLNSPDRFGEMASLLDWALRSHKW